MASFLIDTNVIVALVWESHEHHAVAHRWLQSLQPDDRWATCPITQCGFVRILSNPRAIKASISPHQALEKLREVLRHPQHRFWEDSVDLRHSRFGQMPFRGHQQVTDGYLLALSLEKGGKFVTMDAGVPSLLTPAEAQSVVLLG